MDPSNSQRSPSNVLLILAAFSRHQAALDWARAKAATAWGPLALESPQFDFVETEYYRGTMGEDLNKTFWAFETLADPANLADWKQETSLWEREYASAAGHDEPRPLNLDPGYLSEAKLVLASTKDHAHRIYLRDGIYAEVTLHYQNRGWQRSSWTYPDYQRADYQAFFTACRKYVKKRRRERG